MKHAMIISIIRPLAVVGLLLLMFSCRDSRETAQNYTLAVPLKVAQAEGISVPVYDFASISPRFDQQGDTLFIFNFWATWCKPCVKELPYFERAAMHFSGEPVKITLISLDFSENIEEVLIPFMLTNGLKLEVVNLDDPDANAWIPKVSPAWGGAIPATLFMRKGEKTFFAHAFTYEELIDEIEKQLKR
jgi:thiol-disulfide isomerase/thioredoxin